MRLDKLARTDPAVQTARTTAQNLAATGQPSGGSMRRVQGFNPADVAISFTDVGNVVGGTGVRPYREAAEECGGPDLVRTINVTGSYAYTPFAMIPLGLPLESVTHRERCIGPG